MGESLTQQRRVCDEGCRRPVKSRVKSPGLTREVRAKLAGLSAGEGRGIPGVEVKFVDIGRNTSGEGGDLDGH